MIKWEYTECKGFPCCNEVMRKYHFRMKWYRHVIQLSQGAVSLPNLLSLV